MKKQIVVLLPLLFAACDTSNNPIGGNSNSIASVSGHVGFFLTEIKYAGNVAMEYAGTSRTASLVNAHVDSNGIVTFYDYVFDNIALQSAKFATFIVKIENGFGAETNYADTLLEMSSGENMLHFSVGFSPSPDSYGGTGLDNRLIGKWLYDSDSVYATYEFASNSYTSFLGNSMFDILDKEWGTWTAVYNETGGKITFTGWRKWSFDTDTTEITYTESES